MERKKATETDPHDRLDKAARKMKQMETTIRIQNEILDLAVRNHEALKVRTERLEAQNKELLKTMKSLYEVQDQQDTRIEQLEAMTTDIEAIGRKVGYW